MRTDRLFGLIALVGDVLLVLLSLACSLSVIYFLLYNVPFSVTFNGSLTLFQQPSLYILAALFYALPLFFFGRYKLSVIRSIVPEFSSILKISFFAPVLFFFLYILYVSLFDASLMYSSQSQALQLFSLFLFLVQASLFHFIFSFVGLSAWRFLLRSVQRFFTQRYASMQHPLLILDGKSCTTGRTLEKDMKRAPWLGYRVVKLLDTFDVYEITELIKKDSIKDVIHVAEHYTPSETKKLFELCQEYGVEYHYIPHSSGVQTARFTVHSFAGYPVFNVLGSKINYFWSRFWKRFLDIFGSLVLIILFSPLYIIVTALVVFSSKGPILFRNERVGKGRTLFNYLKFRSMKREHCTDKQNPEEGRALQFEKELIKTHNSKKDNGPLYKIANDPRLTAVGGFIRKWSLDEWPAFFNVLLGSMSLVGPRPHQVREVEQYPDHADRLFDVKPGVTGLAQISGRSDLTFNEELKLDLYYIEQWSLGKDFVILLKTPLAVLGKRGAK